MQLFDHKKNVLFLRFVALSICAAFLYSSFCWLVLSTVSFFETGLVALSVFYVYSHLSKNMNSTESKTVLLALKKIKHVFFPKSVFDFLLLTFILSLLFFYIQNPLYWLLLFLVISLYSVSIPFLKIRESPIGKPLFISLAWTFILLEPLFRIKNNDIQVELICLALIHFIYFFILSVIDDMRDFSFSEKGFKSLPIKYGLDTARKGLLFLLIVFYIMGLFFKPIENLWFFVFDFSLFAMLLMFLFYVKRITFTRIWLIELHLGFLGLEYFIIA